MNRHACFKTACFATLAVSIALSGCGGSSTATISIAGDQIVAINNHVGVTTTEPTQIEITATAIDPNTLTTLNTSSASISALNSETTNLASAQYTKALNFTAKENATLKVTAITANPDGSTKTNSRQLTVHNVVRYMNEDDRQVLSIHRPTQPKPGNPAILFVRGNGLDFSYFYENARDAAKAGYVAATMDFRTFDSFSPSASHMPDQIEDVRCAIQYLKANSAALNIDPDNIGVVGYSIGATMSLLASFGSTAHIANRPDYASRCAYSSENTDIKAIVAMSAPSDILKLLATAKDTKTPLYTRNALESLAGVAKDSSKEIRTHYNQYFNTNPSATIEQWKANIRSSFASTSDAGRMVNWAEKLSPANVLGNKPIPLYIMHGKTDLVFPCKENALVNVAAAKQSDVYYYLFNATEDDHNWLDYYAAPKTQARIRYMDFFNHYLANEPAKISSGPVSCDTVSPLVTGS